MSDKKARTIDGDRISKSALNTDIPKVLDSSQAGALAKLAVVYRRLSELMAGMYTGVGCSGTPRTHHSYDQSKSEQESKD